MPNQDPAKHGFADTEDHLWRSAGHPRPENASDDTDDVEPADEDEDDEEELAGELGFPADDDEDDQ